MQDIARYIDKIIAIVSPKQLVYFAIDGVVRKRFPHFLEPDQSAISLIKLNFLISRRLPLPKWPHRGPVAGHQQQLVLEGKMSKDSRHPRLLTKIQSAQ